MMMSTQQETFNRLHQTDPRLNIFICLGLVILSFSANAWQPLSATVFGCLVLIVAANTPWQKIWTTWWSLRWLLLFTVLMHLLLSPGRLLLGSRWLSLDGLLQGLFVSTQLSVAMISAMLLSLSTTVEDLTAALVWYLKPFARFGLPVESWHKQVLLVLNFLPIVRAEFLATQTAQNNRAQWSITGALDRWVMRVEHLLDRLIVQAESLSERILTDQPARQRISDWPPLTSLLVNQAWIGLLIIGFLVLYSLLSSLS
jgi:energy-coupling factor transport system permease protein